MQTQTKKKRVPADYLQSDIRFQVNDYHLHEKQLQYQELDEKSAVCNGDMYPVISQKQSRTEWADLDFHMVMFGRTMEGFSVCLTAKIYPALMIQLPPQSTSADAENIVKYLCKSKHLRPGDYFYEFKMMHDAGGFHPDLKSETPQFAKFPFLRMWFRHAGILGMCRKVFRCREKPQEPVTVETGPANSYTVTVIEQMVPPVLQFIQQSGVTPSSVISVDMKRVRNHTYTSKRFSHCDIELSCTLKPFAVLNPICILPAAVEDVYPIICTSFDIECLDPAGGFPHAKTPSNSIICIANTTRNFKTGTEIQVVHCLGPCANFPPSTNVKCIRYATEIQLLEGWRDHLVLVEDPDIITGYNIDRFDWNYMHLRYQLLGKGQQTRYPYFGRTVSEPCAFDGDSTFESKAHGAQQNKRYNIPGRINLDLFTYIKQTEKLDSYKLSHVSQKLLGSDKDDMPIPTMFEHWKSGDPRRKYLVAKYCVQDTRLPIDLLLKLLVIPAVVAMSRVTSVFMSDLFRRGQMFKVLSQLFVFARRSNFALTNLPDYVALGISKYQGATVLPVKRGFYSKVVVLDFASLYPSIMIAFNLCYCSWVRPKDKQKCGNLPNFTYRDCKSDLGTVRFQQTLPGILPRMAQSLLKSRSQVKKLMKAAKKAGNHERASVLNAQQLAIKISCNSIYGFVGAAQVGKYPCPPIAASVTAEGRRLIDRTKHFAETKFKHYGTKTIAGDTDSVMLSFDLPETAEGFQSAFRMGHEVADWISAQFPPAIILEFEKLINPGMYMKKKRYLGMAYEYPEDNGKILAKGVATVRRDFALFIRDLYNDIIHLVFRVKDVSKSIEVLRAGLEKLVEGRVPYEKLVLSRQLAGSYKNNNQMQKIVADRMEKRNPGFGPKSGDRVQFVMVELKHGHSKAPNYMKVEDAVFAKEHKVPLDLEYYVKSLKPNMDAFYECFGPAIKQQVARIFLKASGTCNRKRNRTRDVRSYFTKKKAKLE